MFLYISHLCDMHTHTQIYIYIKTTMEGDRYVKSLTCSNNLTMNMYMKTSCYLPQKFIQLKHHLLEFHGGH